MSGNPDDNDPMMTDVSRWHEAARGIELHRSAVIWRVVVLVIAILYAVVQGIANNAAEPGGFAIFLALAELCVTIAAMIGVVRFVTHAPTAADASAGFAVVCLLVIAGTQAYALWILFKVREFLDAAQHATSMWNTPSLDILDQVKRLPTIQLVGAIAGFVAMLLVLGGISRVGRVHKGPELAPRAHRLAVATTLLAVAYGVIMHWVQHARHLSTGEMLTVLAALAIFGLVVLARYIALLTDAGAVMRRLRGSELPEAHLVNT
jgi:peptidoglycan biosynthesis protein MviN/MurJ (putative lipid II flippase)